MATPLTKKVSPDTWIFLKPTFCGITSTTSPSEKTVINSWYKYGFSADQAVTDGKLAENSTVPWFPATVSLRTVFPCWSINSNWTCCPLSCQNLPVIAKWPFWYESSKSEIIKKSSSPFSGTPSNSTSRKIPLNHHISWSSKYVPSDHW